MNSQVLLFVLLLAGLTCSSPARGTTCVLGPPLKIAGKMHGVAMDSSGDHRTNISLRLLDAKGGVKSEVETDTIGRFSLDVSSLPVGAYRLETTTPGWETFIGNVEIVKHHLRLRRRTLVVHMGFDDCDTGVGWR